VWSAGAVLYAMGARSTPYDAPDETDPRFVRRTMSVFPSYFEDSLQDLLGKMFTRSPDDRITLLQVLDHAWLSDERPGGASAEAAGSLSLEVEEGGAAESDAVGRFGSGGDTPVHMPSPLVWPENFEGCPRKDSVSRWPHQPEPTLDGSK
jgi:serine/threonine protein kinase